MKSIFTILLLISNLILFSQIDKVVGDYKLTAGNGDSELFEYDLTLNQDGTFFFHYHSKIKRGNPPEINHYSKGKWTIENNVISFFSDKQKDFDEKYTLDFTNSKARFIIKSPRDTSDQIIKTSIQFLISDIFWMAKIKMFKV